MLELDKQIEEWTFVKQKAKGIASCFKQHGDKKYEDALIRNGYYRAIDQLTKLQKEKDAAE